mgnify:FL=1
MCTYEENIKTSERIINIKRQILVAVIVVVEVNIIYLKVVISVEWSRVKAATKQE